MDAFVTLLKTVIMGIVEGLTEFLPVSSTGHLIVTDAFIGFAASIGGEHAAVTFEIFIQLGAILAVVVYFARDLISLLRRAVSEAPARALLLNVAIAFVPAAAVGFLFSDVIKDALFSTRAVAIALVVGGVVMLLVESRQQRATTSTLESVSIRQALTIGIVQTVALFPGMSRSASTLVGGLLAGLDRSTALRFSFYLSIPTLGIATIYDFLKNLDGISGEALPYFGIGLGVSFVVALIVVKFFLGYVSRRDLKPFAWYRIVAGIVLLVLTAAGWVA
jgi:undecaprenyl-diphosphatase